MNGHLITFASLFLGLVLGPQKVELVVEGAPAAVVLSLDGRELARLTQAPWAAPVDLGDRLTPHLLTARALDASGATLDEARQWLNLPREPAEAALVLEGGGPVPRGLFAGQKARLVWHHLAYDSAQSVRVTFDGAALPLLADGTIALPPYAPARLHLLHSELRFPDGSSYGAELAVGGGGATSADTELTAVPVSGRAAQRGSVAALAGRLVEETEHGRQPLHVSAIERSPARVVMVLDESARAALRALADQGGSLANTRTVLRPGDELRFLFPRTEMVSRRDLPARLFTVTQPFTVADGSFAWLLTRIHMPEEASHQRLTDALAVAGVQAAAGGRARAVVLVLGPEPRDESAYSIAEVRSYLADLRVPLLVWSTGQPSNRTLSEDRRALTAHSPWGEARDIGGVDRVLDAVGRLRDALDAQQTVWVEGSHLPQRIAVTGGRDLALVGVEP